MPKERVENYRAEAEHMMGGAGALKRSDSISTARSKKPVMQLQSEMDEMMDAADAMSLDDRELDEAAAQAWRFMVGLHRADLGCQLIGDAYAAAASDPHDNPSLGKGCPAQTWPRTGPRGLPVEWPWCQVTVEAKRMRHAADRVTRRWRHMRIAPAIMRWRERTHEYKRRNRAKKEEQEIEYNDARR
mgnify:CR=1 FL=1